MKLLKDLVITRKELQGWDRNLSWARDGTLFITSYPDICIGHPIYRKEVKNNSKNLFHIKEYPLEFDNKFEFDSTNQNILLNSQPISFARILRPSPNDALLAVLTSNLNVFLYKKQNLVCNIDEQDKNLEQRSYHCMEWSPKGERLAVGNENGEVVVFKIRREASGGVQYETERTFNLSSGLPSSWVVQIIWNGCGILAILDDNSIYSITMAATEPIRRIRGSSRFKIVDCCVMDDSLLFTDSCYFNKLDLRSEEITSLCLGPSDEFRIVPLRKERKVILLSNKSSCQMKLEGGLRLTPDDIIAPYLERKFRRWSAINNELSKYESTLLIYGISLAPDGYSVAIIYGIERVSMKYRIASEHQVYISFIPLSDSWSISQAATGLAWYQTYQIYQCSLPISTKQGEERVSGECDVNQPLDVYLRSFLESTEMNDLRFLNFIEENPSIEPFRRAIFEYAVARSSSITNPIDKASVQSLATVLGCRSPVMIGVVEFKSELTTETFNFGVSGGSDSILSEQQHTWRRCAVTLLPILTTKVKVCPISNQRIIDISQDNLNDYGWFTRTLLEVLSEESVYSGTTMSS